MLLMLEKLEWQAEVAKHCIRGFATSVKAGILGPCTWLYDTAQVDDGVYETACREKVAARLASERYICFGVPVVEQS